MGEKKKSKAHILKYVPCIFCRPEFKKIKAIAQAEIEA